MNLKTKLAASLLLAASASVAQANTYNVSAVFDDGGVQLKTVFNGSFDWDGSSVTNFNGLLSESMWAWSGSRFDTNGTATGGMNAGSTIGSGYLTEVFSKPGGYGANEAPLLNLTHQLASSVTGNLVTVSTFLKNSTDVVQGGGYDVVTTDNAITYGNNNAFFTLTFDSSNITDTTATTNQMVYGDFTALGMMMPMLTGAVGMSGYYGITNGGGNGGSMGGIPLSLTITEVAAVPVPAAAWLFGGALISLFGANRRKSVLPA